MSFDEYQFGPGTHLRQALEDFSDIAGFVARWNNDAYYRLRSRLDGIVTRRPTRNYEIGERRESKREHPCEIRIAQPGDARDPRREKDLLPMPDGLEACEVQNILEIFDGKPILCDEWMREAQPACRREG
jgi:hypothetical protein